MPDADPRRAALEDLRTADRLIAGVLGSLGSLQRGQVLDMLGGPDTSEGFFGEHAQAETYSAEQNLAEAERHLQSAAKKLGQIREQADTQLNAPGMAEAVFDGVFDLLAVFRSSRNVSTAKKLHAEVRDLFARVRSSDPQLEASVQPLAEWEEGMIDGAVEELKVAAKFRRPQLILVGLVVVACVAFFVWIQMELSRPSAEPLMEALAAGDFDTFEAGVELETDERERFDELRARIEPWGALEDVSWTRSNGRNDKVYVSYELAFENGDARMIVTWDGDRIVEFEIEAQ